jgi:hypothetical protein
MTQIAIGDICRYRGGDIAYVVRGCDPYGRWLCTAKRIDRTRKSAFSLIQAGEGDLVVAVPRPTFAPGTAMMHEGLTCVVERDDGDLLTLNVPAHTHQTRAKDGLHVPASRVEISKADAVLDSL